MRRRLMMQTSSGGGSSIEYEVYDGAYIGGYGNLIGSSGSVIYYANIEQNTTYQINSSSSNRFRVCLYEETLGQQPLSILVYDNTTGEHTLTFDSSTYGVVGVQVCNNGVEPDTFEILKL